MRIEGVILAAGLSSRLPEYKMTLKINQDTILDLAIKSMISFCDRIIVVTGHRKKDIEDICSRYPKVVTVYNEDYEAGMFTSIKKGLSTLNCDLFFMMPGDYSQIKKDVFKSLIESSGELRIPSYNRRRGHPLLMTYSLGRKCIEDDSYDNLRDFINDHDITYVDVDDDGVLKDIDTIEDYKEILRRIEVENNR